MLENITVSIVLFNNPKDQLSKAIDSALSSQLVSCIYLIDNSPNDDLHVLANNERIKYIFNNKNIGFGAGHNVILRQTDKIGKYHLVLNPDIYFNSNILTEIYKYLEENVEVGLLMPNIYYPDNNKQFLPKLLPSLFSILKRKLPFPNKIKNIVLYNYELRFIKDEVVQVPIISGCFSFFRVEVFKKVGYYDERFFMYFEDFDISRRVNKYYKAIYYSKIHVFHEYARGAQKNFKLFKIFISSLFKYFNKWGWIFDKERISINKKTISNIKNT